MTENELLLSDRITKIKSMNDLYDLENNSYISFSGGKDSTVLSKLIDLALPGNKIPRVYINTRIEYNHIVSFVEKQCEYIWKPIYSEYRRIKFRLNDSQSTLFE